MIRHISEFFDTKLALTGWVEKFFPLVTLLNDDGKQTPNQYIGRGQYETISNFDNWSGMAYIRLSGDPNSSEDTERQTMKACSEALTINYPIKFVFCIKRTQLKFDDAFAEDRLVSDFIKILSVKNGSLKSNLNAITTNIVPDSWSTDPVEVSAGEYQGRDFSVNPEYVYGAINFLVTILIDKSCITDSCEDMCYAYAN